MNGFLGVGGACLLLDKLIGNRKNPEEIGSLLKDITKAVLERALRGELTEHLGYAKHDPSGRNSGDSRNGVTKKTLKGGLHDERGRVTQYESSKSD